MPLTCPSWSLVGAGRVESDAAPVSLVPPNRASEDGTSRARTVSSAGSVSFAE
jgi:hypothetical protein